MEKMPLFHVTFAKSSENFAHVLIVQALISVQALVFDMAQLTCQKRFDCRNAILGSSAILLRYVVQLNCGSSFAVGRHFLTYPMLNEA